MRISLAYILSLLFIFGCRQIPDSFDNQVAASNLGSKSIADDALELSEEIEIEPPRTAEPLNPPWSNKLDKNMVIKNGFMSMRVEHLEAAKDGLDSIIVASRSYYESEQYNLHPQSKSYALLIRIPSERFDRSFYSYWLSLGYIGVEF